MFPQTLGPIRPASHRSVAGSGASGRGEPGDKKNKQAVVDLIINARNKGTAIIGIFHDEYVRESVGTSIFDIEQAKKVA